MKPNRKKAALWSPEFVDHLLKAQNHRDFIRLFFRTANTEFDETKTPHLITYAEFSRRVGIRSRAYIPDLLSGRKNLGLKGLERICNGLQIQGIWREYFALLISGGDTKKIKDRIQSQSKITRTLGKPAAKRYYLSDHAPRVYAACGSKIHGASKKEIVDRTRLSSVSVERILNELVISGLLIKNGDRFYPVGEHVDSDHNESDQSFVRNYIFTMNTTRKRQTLKPSANDALFFASTFSIKKEKMPEICAKLRKLLIEFVDDNESYDGETISDLIVGYTDNRFEKVPTE